MASLHKDPRGRSPCWYCAYRLGDGRRTMRSTGEVDRKRAKVKCECFERIAEEEARGAVSRDLLERIVNDTLYRLGHEPVQAPTVREFLETWLVGERGAVAPLTHSRYSQVVRDFLASLGSRADSKLTTIREADVLRYRDWLLSGGRSPQTVNNSIREILKRPFKIAVESGLLDRNPVALVRMLKGTKATKGTFSPEQISQLLSTLEGDWKGLTLAGWYTGARLGDLSRLRWSSVDLDEHTISFTQGKTGNVVKIPIHPELEAWLRANPGRAAAGAFVFSTLCNRPLNGYTGLSSTFTRLVRKAGIEAPPIRERGGEHGRTVSSLSFHSLRHSFNSALANHGVSQEHRKLLVGHLSSKINSHYTHMEFEPLREAVSRLPSLPKL